MQKSIKFAWTLIFYIYAGKNMENLTIIAVNEINLQFCSNLILPIRAFRKIHEMVIENVVFNEIVKIVTNLEDWVHWTNKLNYASKLSW